MKKHAPDLKAPSISAADRFGFTLFVSAALNAIVVLGVTFNPLDNENGEEVAPTLEIVLVPTQSDRAPEEADFLAQSNQLGSGEAKDKRSITSPTPAPFTTSDTNASPAFLPQLKQQPKPAHDERELLTVPDSDWSIPSRKQDQPELPDIKKPTATDVMRWGEQIARQQAMLDQLVQAEAKRPRIGTVTSVSAKEYKYASYIKDWERKVERVGAVNFPDEARRRNLQGDLLLAVAVNSDGTIVDAQIKRSSGHRVLDDAALRIVHQAAPFAPLPPTIRKEFDVLYITRTWQFLPGGGLDTK